MFTYSNSQYRKSLPKHVFAAMEKELHERDRVGLQDQVLLENFENDKDFIENLRKRFQENIIYVSLSVIGPYEPLIGSSFD